MSQPLRVAYAGPLADPASGYGVAAWGNLGALWELQATEPGLVQVCGLPLGAGGWPGPWPADLLLTPRQRTVKRAPNLDLEVPPDVVVIHHRPDALPAAAAALRAEGYTGPLVFYTVFETNRLPGQVAQTLGAANPLGFLVPATFQADGLRASGLTQPALVVPHPLEPATWTTPPAQQVWAKHRTAPTIFYWVGALQSAYRKGLPELLKAWQVAFPNEKAGSAELHLKINEGDQTLWTRMSRQLTRSDIKVTSSRLSAQDMWQYHMDRHVYVSPHRGEGFGLGMFQALAVRNRVIRTCWSGFDAPAECDAIMSVPCSAVEVNAQAASLDHLPYFVTKPGERLHWAAPDVTELTAALHATTWAGPPAQYDAPDSTFIQAHYPVNVGRILLQQLRYLLQIQLVTTSGDPRLFGQQRWEPWRSSWDEQGS